MRGLALTLKNGNDFLLKRPLHKGYTSFMHKPDFTHKSACCPYSVWLSRWSYTRTVRVLAHALRLAIRKPADACSIYSQRQALTLIAVAALP